jgi:hypothetical protein
MLRKVRSRKHRLRLWKRYRVDPKKWLVVVRFAFYDALRRFWMVENVRRAVGGIT